MKSSMALVSILLLFVIATTMVEAGESGWSSKIAIAKKAFKYMQGLYSNAKDSFKGRTLGLFGDDGDDEDALLILLLGGAALLLPLLLGGLALAALAPLLTTGLTAANTGLTGLNTLGTTGVIPTVTASTFNPGGRRRRSAAGTGFPSKLRENIEYFLNKLE